MAFTSGTIFEKKLWSVTKIFSVNIKNLPHQIQFDIYKSTCYEKAWDWQIRTEISPYKIRKKDVFFSKLLDLTAFVSGKITSVYCQILEILGQKRHFLAI